MCNSQTYGQLPRYRYNAVTAQFYSRNTLLCWTGILTQKRQQDCAYTHRLYTSYPFMENRISAGWRWNISSSRLTCPPVSSEVWGSLMLTNAPYGTKFLTTASTTSPAFSLSIASSIIAARSDRIMVLLSTSTCQHMIDASCLLLTRLAALMC